MIDDFQKDIYGNTLSYLNNTSLKGKDQKLSFTKEHIIELVKCQQDIHYFSENYYKLVHQDYGLVKIKLRDYQDETLSDFVNHRFNILKFPRQSGKSTIFAVFVLHYILFNADKNVAILANKAKQAMEILERIKTAYINLPKWLQQGIVTWNKGEIQLENGCRVQANSTSSDAIRGQSISLLILDEMAFVDTNVFDPFWNSIYPTISSAKSSRVILVSTPNGMNHFYDFWTQAEEGSNMFNPIEINWWDVPGYGCNTDTFEPYGVNDTVDLLDTNENEIKETLLSAYYDTLPKGYEGDLRENKNNRFKKAESDGTFESFYGAYKKKDNYYLIHSKWRDETIANMGYRKFSQEFGGDFLAAADSLISSEYLRDIKFSKPLDIRLDATILYKTFMTISGKLDEYTRMYKLPEKDHVYTIGVDPAKITESSDGDCLAIQVFDITKPPIEQVCVIEIPTGIPYTEVHEIVASLGRFYNDAWIFIENNDQTGLLILDKLWQLEEYEFLYSEKPLTPGYRTDKKNRNSNILRLKDLIESKKMILVDNKTVSQFSVFIKKKGKYSAETGYKDDLIMSIVHATFYLTDLMLFDDHIMDMEKYGVSTYRELQNEQMLLKQQEFNVNLDSYDNMAMPMGTEGAFLPDEEHKVF